MPTLPEEFRGLLLGLAEERPSRDLLYVGAGQGPKRAPRRPLFQHVSQCVEIAMPVEGESRVATPSGSVHLTQGRLLVIERGVYHAELPVSLVRAYSLFWCHCYQNRGLLVRTSFDPRAGFRNPSLELLGRANLEAISNAIATELGAREWGHARAVNALVTYLACLLLRRLARARTLERKDRESPIVAGDPRKWIVIQAALEFCDAHFREGITVRQVAEAVGYSPRYLGELVSTHLGHTLADHLLRLRIEESKRLLGGSDLSVHHVAEAVGYTDPAHFTRAFRRATGTTPKLFRRNARLL